MHGKVKVFLESKGYGFLKPSTGGPDVFFHFSALPGDGFRTIEADTEVLFDLEADPFREELFRASNIQIKQEAGQ